MEIRDTSIYGNSIYGNYCYTLKFWRNIKREFNFIEIICCKSSWRQPTAAYSRLHDLLHHIISRKLNYMCFNNVPRVKYKLEHSRTYYTTFSHLYGRYIIVYLKVLIILLARSTGFVLGSNFNFFHSLKFSIYKTRNYLAKHFLDFFNMHLS